MRVSLSRGSASRLEKKFPIKSQNADNLLAWFFKVAQSIPYRSRIVKSIYFDTPDFSSFLDSEEGLGRRSKIRLRSYDDDKMGRFERKSTLFGSRFKAISSERIRIDTINSDFEISDWYSGLVKPVLRVTYQRYYFMFLKDLRVTVDVGLRYYDINADRCIADSFGVVELKSTSVESVREFSMRMDLREQRFSKYCRGIKILRI